MTALTHFLPIVLGRLTYFDRNIEFKIKGEELDFLFERIFLH